MNMFSIKLAPTSYLPKILFVLLLPIGPLCAPYPYSFTSTLMVCVISCDCIRSRDTNERKHVFVFRKVA